MSVLLSFAHGRCFFNEFDSSNDFNPDTDKSGVNYYSCNWLGFILAKLGFAKALVWGDAGKHKITYVNTKSFEKWKERHKGDDSGLDQDALDAIPKNDYIEAIKLICENFSKINLDPNQKKIVRSKQEGLELNFFDPIEGVFCQKALIHQCNTQEQYDFAITLCLHILALAQNNKELAIAEQVLENFNFSEIPEKNPSSPGTPPPQLAQYIVNAAITFMEKSQNKTFNKDFKSITDDLMKRFNSVYFHGTNLPALEKIKKEGLSRSKRSYDRTEMDEVAKIGNRFLGGQTFKYFHSQPSKSIYVTNGAQVSWHFAKRSPEWFASFFENISGAAGEKDNPFYAEKRDRFIAMQTLEDKLNNNKHLVTPQEALKVKKFVEKYWKEYGDPTGAVLFVRFPHTEHNDKVVLVSPSNHKDCRRWLETTMTTKITHMDSGGITITDRDFAPKDITCVRIPFARIKGRGIDPDLYWGS